MGNLHNDYTAYNIIFKFNVYMFPLNSCSKKSEFNAIIIHNVAFSRQSIDSAAGFWLLQQKIRLGVPLLKH